MSFTIKQARLFADKTQQEMADFLGIHVQTYRKLEENPAKATVEQAQKISEITGISYDQIFFANKLYLK